MLLLQFILISIGTAFIVTGWQGYKDTPWENFSYFKFSRSYIVSILLGILLYFLHIKSVLIQNNLGITFLSILSLERGIGEIYKGFFRKQSHPEYVALFHKLHLRISSFIIQLVSGLAFSATISMVVIFCFHLLSLILPPPPSLLTGIVVGLTGGLFVATGGAIKDSQFEGFKIKKFIRSPFFGILGGIVFHTFTSSLILLFLASIGFERITVELYKTFIKRQVRGIFDHQIPKFTYWLTHRRVFFALYLIGLTMFIVSVTQYT